CKKQTVVANSTTEAEYVAASNCCGQFWSTAKTKTINEETHIHALVDGKKIVITELSVRKVLQFTDEDADEVVLKERGDCLERVATTASSLKAKQVSGNILKTRSEATLNEPNPQGTSSGSDFRRQDTMGDTIAQTSLGDYKFEIESQEVREERRVKNSQAQKIIQEITFVDETQGRYGDNLIFDTCVLDDEEVFVTTTSATTITSDDLTLAQTLMEIRSARPKAKGIIFREQGKGIMEEPEKPTKRKDQIRHDEEVAQRLQAQMQAELEEEDRLVRQREEEANIVS
ncbi:hypothetical protein Tco_1073870, partial [Tanacetum coccineum]